MFLRKRRNLDLNDLNFIQDPLPLFPPTLNPFGLPVFREITHPDFVPNTYSAVYKQVNTTDNYGFFTTFPIRPGVRKMRNDNFHIVVEQTEDEFKNPLWLVGQFAFRPCIYSEQTDTFTPAYDYFNFDRSINMFCTQSSNEFKVRTVGKVLDSAILSDAAPEQIDLTAGGTYRQYPLHDTSFIVATETTNSFTAGNGASAKVYSTHRLSEPLFVHQPDLANFPEPLCLEAKLILYFAHSVHKTAALNDSTPVLELIPADNIISCGGTVQIV